VRLTEHAWLDRDLSWLEFYRRVLAEALDERNRLVECSRAAPSLTRSSAFRRDDTGAAALLAN
jgi:hypothetical protein